MIVDVAWPPRDKHLLRCLGGSNYLALIISFCHHAAWQIVVLVSPKFRLNCKIEQKCNFIVIFKRALISRCEVFKAAGYYYITNWKDDWRLSDFALHKVGSRVSVYRVIRNGLSFQHCGTLSGKRHRNSGRVGSGNWHRWFNWCWDLAVYGCLKRILAVCRKREFVQNILSMPWQSVDQSLVSKVPLDWRYW